MARGCSQLLLTGHRWSPILCPAGAHRRREPAYSGVGDHAHGEARDSPLGALMTTPTRAVTEGRQCAHFFDPMRWYDAADVEGDAIGRLPTPAHPRAQAAFLRAWLAGISHIWIEANAGHQLDPAIVVRALRKL